MLTDDQREVVVLRFVADLAVKDVARILGKRQGAVKMLQARGLERLHELLQMSHNA
jgi:RNA polymerase sigma-70 factor (ECF subfamily)